MIYYSQCEAVSQNALSHSLQHEVLLFKAFESRGIEIYKETRRENPASEVNRQECLFQTVKDRQSAVRKGVPVRENAGVLGLGMRKLLQL